MNQWGYVKEIRRWREFQIVFSRTGLFTNEFNDFCSNSHTYLSDRMKLINFYKGENNILLLLSRLNKS